MKKKCDVTFQTIISNNNLIESNFEKPMISVITGAYVDVECARQKKISNLFSLKLIYIIGFRIWFFLFCVHWSWAEPNYTA